MWLCVVDPLHNPLCNRWCRRSKIQILGPLNMIIHYIIIIGAGVVKSKYWAPQYNPLHNHWCRGSRIQILGPSTQLIHYTIIDAGVVKFKYWARAPQHNPLHNHAIVTTYKHVGQLYPNTEG